MTRTFTPIDALAKTGSYHLLQDKRGHQHCGYWDRQAHCFAYSSGRPIRNQITAYAARTGRAHSGPAHPGQAS